MMKFMIILLLKKNQLEYKFGNNFIVPIRSDGTTALCKAGGKR